MTTDYEMKKRDHNTTCWAHVDQAGKHSKHFDGYQSFISLTDNQHKTMRIWKKTHKFYYKYCKRHNLLKSNSRFQKIDKDTIDALDTERVSLKTDLRVPKGALVIWDSRLIHQNTYGEKGNGEERRVQYISFRPKTHPLNTDSQKEKRTKYFHERRTTAHDPIIRVNSEQPQTYGNNDLLIDYSQVPQTDLTSLFTHIKKIL